MDYTNIDIIHMKSGLLIYLIVPITVKSHDTTRSKWLHLIRSNPSFQHGLEDHPTHFEAAEVGKAHESDTTHSPDLGDPP